MATWRLRPVGIFDLHPLLNQTDEELHLLFLSPEVIAYSFQYLCFEDLSRVLPTCAYFVHLHKRYASLCHVTMRWRPFLAHCDGIIKNQQHYLCVSCMNSVASQHGHLRSLLSCQLADVLDGNSIDEIVTFCVGKVPKTVVDPASGASKRKLEARASPSKRRRLK